MNMYVLIRQLIQHPTRLIARCVILDIDMAYGIAEAGNDGINAAQRQLWRIVDGNDHIY